MKRTALIVALLLCAFTFSSYAQMTDSQVVDYVKTGLASGKSQDQIGRELLARGVTAEQAERIKKTYESQPADGVSVTSQALSQGVIARESNEEAVSSPDASVLDGAAGGPTAGGGATLVFGHDIFNGRTITFEPNENAATPEDYRLGPGDQLIIDIWGNSEGNYVETISPEGRINISQIGPIQLNGLTIKAASEKIRKALVAKYSGIGGSRPTTSVSVTLGRIRTIQVNVMGEVNTPGTYRLSSFSTVFHALYRAGGVRGNGSLRDIKVIRGSEQIAAVDVYEYLMEGKSETDIALKEGDIIIVPPYVNIATVNGSVKRPMSYELLGGETLSTLLEYAGGFTSDAYPDDFQVIREKGEEHQIFTVKAKDKDSFVMEDGDLVSVGANLDRFSNMVEVRGYVFRPGMYEFGGDIATVRQLITRSGGLKEDAFDGRALIVREKEDLSLETNSFDLGALLAGKTEDILLRRNDIVVVSGKYELYDRGVLTINGYVASPGVFPFTENTTVEDLILLAGGLLDGASMARVDVARRVTDPNSMAPLESVGETFSFAIQDGLAIGEGENFILQPYDVVSVRKSPAYSVQQFVEVAGEVNFPGSYVLLAPGERLSDLINRCGGITPQGYLRGGTIQRRLTEDEIARQAVKGELLRSVSGRDTLDEASVTISDTYYFAVDMEQALNHPGSRYDPVMQEGDRIFIPVMQYTVRISGAVLYPNTVIYMPGKNYRYYVNAAGGFTSNSRKNKAFILYPNGMARPAHSSSADIEPGCEIIVPQKGRRTGMSTGEVLSLATSTTSLLSMIALLISRL